MSRKELQAMAKEYGLQALYYNRRWRITWGNATDFHVGGYFTGTIRECLIWLAGYVQALDNKERSR